MKRYLIFLMAAVCFTLFAGELRAKENVTEQEIRQIICQIDNGNYQGAEADLEKVLQKDPQNVYALRLLPGVLANQIKKGDKSPENIARIRKAIQAYEQSLKKLQFPAEEGRSVEFFVIDLYGRISEEEKKAFLLKKAEDPTLPAEERRNAYGSLAVALNTCANDITGTPPVQGIAIKAGKQIYVYTKPRKAEDFNRLKNCTANGMELIDKAIEIEKQSGKESAATWSLKADFLLQKMRIAEMEGKTEEKEQLRTEIDAARKRYREISDERREENNYRVDKPLPTAIPAEIFEELTAYKIETKLSEVVKEIYIPTIDYLELVAPVPPPSNKRSSLKRNENAKALWKIFSPNGEFSALLPRNAKIDSTATGEIYEAKSEGIDFFIISQPKNTLQTAGLDDKFLNVLAWVMADAIGGLSMKDEWGNTFEINFVRNEKISGQPAKIYAYSLGSCKSKTDGMLIMLAGKKNNYAISIKEANEQDARTQRFLKSLKLKG